MLAGGKHSKHHPLHLKNELAPTCPSFPSLPFEQNPLSFILRLAFKTQDGKELPETSERLSLDEPLLLGRPNLKGCTMYLPKHCGIIPPGKACK